MLFTAQNSLIWQFHVVQFSVLGLSNIILDQHSIVKTLFFFKSSLSQLECVCVPFEVLGNHKMFMEVNWHKSTQLATYLNKNDFPEHFMESQK